MRKRNDIIRLSCGCFVAWLGAFSALRAAEARAIAPPQIPANVFKITDYGAVADGKTLSTGAIASAVAAAVKAGGGSVVIPAGEFMTGPVTLANNLDLHLDKGAKLVISNDIKNFKHEGKGFESCVVASECHDVSLTGEGTIEGQGEFWWKNYVRPKNAAADVPYPEHRPYLVVFNHCTRVLVKGVTLQNSPSFHLVPRSCRDVVIDGVHFNAPAKSPNTDALDPSGWNYLITRCVFDVGDDCIAVKASGRPEGDHLSCEDFLITDCTFNHGHGMSIGGQTPGGLRRMVVRDCTFDSTDAGIRMKANRGSGGLVEDVLCENLKMKNVKVSIFITSYYPTIPSDLAADPAQPINDTTPIWRNIRINNVTSENSAVAGRILGLAEMPVQDIILTNVHIDAAKGMQISHAKGIRFVDSSVTAAKGPAIDAQDADVTGLK